MKGKYATDFFRDIRGVGSSSSGLVPDEGRQVRSTVGTRQQQHGVHTRVKPSRWAGTVVIRWWVKRVDNEHKRLSRCPYVRGFIVNGCSCTVRLSFRLRQADDGGRGRTLVNTHPVERFDNQVASGSYPTLDEIIDEHIVRVHQTAFGGVFLQTVTVGVFVFGWLLTNLRHLVRDFWESGIS